MKTNKNVLKKVASVGVSVAMMGATLVGATADLGDLPAPFVADGVDDVLFVIGADARTSDTLGAVDIATAFQSAAVTEQTVNLPGTSTSYTSEDGLEIAQSGDDLNFQEAFLVSTGFKFDRNDLPELLADGSIKDQDENEEWDYDQEITFPNATYPRVTFGIPDSDVDLPQLYVDFNSASTPAYRIVVDFDQNANLSALDDSEAVDIFGRPFTFDPDNDAADSQVTLFGSDVVTFLELGVPQTIDVDGSPVEVEVVGGNSDSATNNIVLSVNGQRETVEEGQSRTIGGIEIFIQDVFVTNIPTLDASATIFVGSEEFKIDNGALDKVELNGNDLDGVYGNFTGASWNAVNTLQFEFRPEDLDADEDQYLLSGESVSDPMFDIELIFAGPRPALNEEERSFLELERSGDEYDLTFTNRDGTTYEDITIMEQVTGDSIRYLQSGSGNTNRLVLNVSESIFTSGQLTEDDFFFVYEGSTTNPISKILYIDDFEEENSVETVVIKDLATGDTEELEEGETHTAGLTVDQINEDSNLVNFTGATDTRIVNWFVTDGDLKVFLGPIYVGSGENLTIDSQPSATNVTAGVAGNFHNATGSQGNNITLVFQEDFNGRFADENTEAAAISWTTLFHGDDSDEDIELFSSNLTDGSGAEVQSGDDDYDDYEYAMTRYGTYSIRETENDGESYQVWYPKDGEADYVVFLAPSGTSVTTSAGSAGGVVTQSVNKFSVGAAVLDEDVDLATAPANLVVVGGPIVNTIAADLLGNPTEAEISEMFAPGTAMVKLFDLDNGNVAMLVAGYSARDTQAASRKVALLDGTLFGEEVKLTVTSLNSVTVQGTQ